MRNSWIATPDWPLIGAIAWPLLVALLLGWAVRRALLALAARARRHAAQRLRARVAQVIAVPAAVALPLLFLGVAVAATPLSATWIARSQHILGLGGLLCLVWLAVRAVRAIERRIVRDHPVDVADNLVARRVQTQTRVISGVVQGAIVLVGVALALMTFPAIRQVGTTLLASAGVIGLIAGIAAKPVFGNLIAGLQIALAQPIRLDDVVIVEGEWGRVEEITGTYVVMKLWDERRLIVPLHTSSRSRSRTGRAPARRCTTPCTSTSTTPRRSSRCARSCAASSRRLRSGTAARPTSPWWTPRKTR